MTDAKGLGQIVTERTIQQLLPASEQHTVSRVQVGLIYSAVQLDSGAVGVAYTFPESRVCHDGDGGSVQVPTVPAAECHPWYV